MDGTTSPSVTQLLSCWSASWDVCSDGHIPWVHGAGVHVTAFYLFDVSDAIDLQGVGAAVGPTAATRLMTRPATPSYLQYQQPPLALDGSVIGAGVVDGCHVRFKAFDYGVLSVALTRDLPDTWEQLLEAGPGWQDNSRLLGEAERLCRELLSRIDAAVSGPHEQFLNEDYVVYTILNEDDSPSADQLLTDHGMDITRLLRGEREALSRRKGMPFSASPLVLPE